MGKERPSQEHHNPPKWFVRHVRLGKGFYSDPQHTRMVDPKEHKFINSHYTEQMKQVYATIPKGTRMVETRVIRKEELIFERNSKTTK